jgi:hypothetical protein
VITGSATTCMGNVTVLTDTSLGGVWSSSNISVATIGTTFGDHGSVIPVSPGTATITYTLGASYVTATVMIAAAPTAIVTPASVCVGDSVTATESMAGGYWSTFSSTISVNSASGAVTGVSAGTALVTYALPGLICAMVAPVNVVATPAAITGVTSLCASATTTLSDASAGGTWASSSTAVANVVTSLGLVSGVSAGTAVITYIVGTACFATTVVTVGASPTSITGASSMCVGTSATLSDGTGGGTWSSSDAVVATIGLSTGVVTGAVAGTTVITYSLGTGCKVTMVEDVVTSPAALTGPSSVCAGLSITLSDIATGGAWGSSNTAIATVGTGGVVTGVSAGTTIISYVLGTSCLTSTVITVGPYLSTYTVTGGGAYCPGGPGVSVGLSASQSFTTYQLYVSGVAVGFGIGGTGAAINFGLQTTPGTYTITGTAIGGCTGYMSGSVTVSISSGPGTITGYSPVCIGSATTCADTASGGVWSSSNTAVATIGSISGVVSGISAGTSIISYTVGGGCSSTAVISVYPSPAGISGPSGLCIGSTIALSDAIVGGTWVSATPTIATVGISTGIVSGLAAGAVNISYTIGSCYAVHTVTVVPTPAAITGPSSVCGSSTITLSDAVGGGAWSVAPAFIATIVSGTGILTGISSGTATISYVLGTGCLATKVITVGPAVTIYAVTGGGPYCAGGTGVDVGVASSTSGVTYQLYNGGVAVGSAIAGTGGAISFGLQTVAGAYTVEAAGIGGCTATMSGSVSVTIDPLPLVYMVTGGGTYCAGGTGELAGLSASDPGINYQLWNGGATVGAPIAGAGSSLSFGLLTGAGDYTVVATNATTGCTSAMTDSAVIAITPSVTPSVSISAAPGDTVCSGTPVIYSATPVNGGAAPVYEWFFDGMAAGSGTSWTYTPVSGDVVSVIMTSDATCAMPSTATASVTMTVLSGSVAASASTAACGGGVTLTASGATTYSWSPSTGLSCATCASTTATVSGTINYVVTGNPGGACSSTASVTVNGNRIYGSVSFSSLTPDTLDMKVWLIQFNPSDSVIQAQDSTITCLSGGMPYYEFDGEPGGNYFVKGMLLYGNPAGASGYVPTYGASSPYWYDASNIAHTSGSDNMNIDMVYGTVPSGPGFIGGTILSGAGRGTSVMPAVGMLVYLKDAATDHILTHAVTDGSGAYSFANIANGSYIIYPENFSDYTTPAIATVSTPDETVTNINFMQHTTSRTITPLTTNLVKTVASSELISVYPNPTTGALNIQWSNQLPGNAEVIVTDIVGREVNKSILNINTASGQAQINLAGLENGIYLLTIKSDHISYNAKLQVQQ